MGRIYKPPRAELPDTRICSDCGDELSAKDFYRDRYWLRTECKRCHINAVLKIQRLTPKPATRTRLGRLLLSLRPSGGTFA